MEITTPLASVYVFFLAAFIGFQVITKIPPLLHTPLMSATNAISAICVVAAIIIAGSGNGALVSILGTVAVACAMCNVVGGFLITERMLKMFKKGKSDSQKGEHQR
ncbi:MAG: NAD(P) transhydrogenase subunit alpha [Deltaproteobacteria bacterium]